MPAWLGHEWPVALLGVDYFAGVRSVDLDAPESPADLRHVARLKNIEFVNVRGPNVTAAGLTAFEGLPNLRSLWIGNRGSHCSEPFKRPCCAARVTDVGLAIIGKRKILEYLYLNGTPITDAGLADLAGLTARASAAKSLFR